MSSAGRSGCSVLNIPSTKQHSIGMVMSDEADIKLLHGLVLNEVA